VPFAEEEEPPVEEAVETIQLSGYDPQGEPSIRRTAQGRLWLCIELMPPSWAPEEERLELGRWQYFAKDMERAIGVRVVWEDREWFRIDRPERDTVYLIQRFLCDIRRRYDTGGGRVGSKSAPPKPKKGRGRKKPSS
jgi:hypothetical protein